MSFRWKIASLVVALTIAIGAAALITTPGECVSFTGCSWTKRYYMYVYQDLNQPETWQPYCYIISGMYDLPSAGDVARICTPAGSDYTYSPTSMVYKGWVFTDGHGGHHFGWPDWQPQWFNPDFARPWKPCFIIYG